MNTANIALLCVVAQQQSKHLTSQQVVETIIASAVITAAICIVCYLVVKAS